VQKRGFRGKKDPKNFLMEGEKNTGGVGGQAPRSQGNFLQFFSRKYAFLNILWSEFMLKTRFKMTAKCAVVRP